MSVGTIQPSPSNSIDIQHRLAQIKLQLQHQSAFAGSSALTLLPRYVFALNFRFSCLISHHLQFYSIIYYHTLLSYFLSLHTTDGSQLAITKTWSIMGVFDSWKWEKMKSEKTHFPLPLFVWTRNGKTPFSFFLLHLPYTLPSSLFQCTTINFMVM